MARLGTTYRHQYPRPGDSRLDREQEERKESLATLVNEDREPEDRDLVAVANEALDAKVTELGGQPLDAAPMDAALMGIKQRAAAAVAAASLSNEERQAQATATALAAVLTERGIVPAPPSPVAGDEYEDEDEDEDLDTEDSAVYGWHDDAEGVWYATDKDGNYLKDANDRYITYDDVVPEDELNEGDEVLGYLEENDDAA